MSWKERLLARISPELNSGCWVWMGKIGNYGYGKLNVDRRERLAYQVAYEMLVGPIPSGMELDHLCRCRWCVNPAHLEPVTHRENCLRGTSPAATNAKMVTCRRGHLFDATNTYRRKDRLGRMCRTCEAANKRRRRLAAQAMSSQSEKSSSGS